MVEVLELLYKMKCSTQKKIQYHSRRIAERSMLSIYKNGKETFGCYQCPYCFHYHITSEYDNRSKQSLHEFRCLEEKRKAKIRDGRRRRRNRKAERKKCLSLTEQREVFKTFTPTVYKKTIWQRLRDIVRG